MIIEYTTTTDDLVALTADQLTKRSAKREIRSSGVWIGALVFMGFAYSTWGRGMVWVAAGAVPGIAAVLLYPFLARRYALSKARKLFSNSTMGKGAIGWHRASLRADGFHEENDMGSGTVRYDSIASVSETIDHAFVYFSDVSAVVIPRKGVTSGDLRSFLGELAARVGSNGASPK